MADFQIKVDTEFEHHALKPEGLSPAFGSVASPSIYDASSFKWVFTPAFDGDYQFAYTLRIFNSGGTLLKEIYEESAATEVPLSSTGVSFQEGQTYQWEVEIKNKWKHFLQPTSERVTFTYATFNMRSGIYWSHTPREKDVVVRNTYFAEIKSNLKRVFIDMKVYDDTYLSMVDDLFLGEMVPARDDFYNLEGIVNFLGQTISQRGNYQIDELVLDTLGASDIKKIQSYISSLYSITPEPPTDVAMSLTEPDMYGMATLTGAYRVQVHVDLNWDSERLNPWKGSISFNSLSPSDDVLYYQCSLEYGPTANPIRSNLYYRADGLTGKSFPIAIGWDGRSGHDARIQFTIQAVNDLGSSSSPLMITKNFDTSSGIPLGVDYYTVEMQRKAVGVTEPEKKGIWHDMYEGPYKNQTFTLDGTDAAVFFRVGVTDKSGWQSAWMYYGPINFDAPTDPTIPVRPKCTWTATKSTVTVKWLAIPNALTYEWKMWSHGTSKKQIGLTFTQEELASNESYTFYVRAINKAGVAGDWTTVVAKTSAAGSTTPTPTPGNPTPTPTPTETVKIWDSNGSRSWRLKYGWRTDNTLVYQGEWSNWGVHKGLWLFDEDAIRARIAGKTIKKVRVWMQRDSAQHGVYGDGKPTVWLHNKRIINTSDPEPAFTDMHQSSLGYSLGESGWFEVPKAYAEKIRDSQACGFGVYVNNRGASPYLQFKGAAKIEITFLE